MNTPHINSKEFTDIMKFQPSNLSKIVVGGSLFIIVLLVIFALFIEVPEEKLNFQVKANEISLLTEDTASLLAEESYQKILTTEQKISILSLNQHIKGVIYRVVKKPTNPRGKISVIMTIEKNTLDLKELTPQDTLKVEIVVKKIPVLEKLIPFIKRK